MKTCKTCKYFVIHNGTHGYCALIGDLNDWDVVNNPEWIGKEKPEHEMAATIDAEGYFSQLICSQDFGCVLHTEKEPNHV